MTLMIAFCIWCLCGIFFIGIGLFCRQSKTPMGFWANDKAPKVKDIKGYNRALGKCWITYGIIFILIGFPILFSQDSLWILVPVLGTLFDTLALILAYTMIVTPRYIE